MWGGWEGERGRYFWTYRWKGIKKTYNQVQYLDIIFSQLYKNNYEIYGAIIIWILPGYLMI